MGVALLFLLAFHPPNFAPPLLFLPNNLLSCQEKPAGIRALLLIIAFAENHRCLALPRGGREMASAEE